MEELKQKISQLLRDLGAPEDQIGLLAEAMIVEIFDKSYYEMLSTDQLKEFEEAALSNNAQKTAEITQALPQEELATTVQKHTEKVLQDFLQDYFNQADESMRESLRQALQKEVNMNLVGQISQSGNAQNALEKLSQEENN